MAARLIKRADNQKQHVSPNSFAKSFFRGEQITIAQHPRQTCCCKMYAVSNQQTVLELLTFAPLFSVFLR